MKTEGFLSEKRYSKEWFLALKVAYKVRPVLQLEELFSLQNSSGQSFASPQATMASGIVSKLAVFVVLFLEIHGSKDEFIFFLP